MAKFKKLMLLCTAFVMTASLGITACSGGHLSSSSSDVSTESSSDASSSEVSSDASSSETSSEVSSDVSSSETSSEASSETSSDDSSSEDSSSETPVIPEENFVAVEGYSFDDMKKVTANNAWGARTDVTVNLPSAGKYVVFSDNEYANFGENNDEGDYDTTYTFEVTEAGAYTFDVLYYNYADIDTPTGDVAIYVYKVNEIELSMDGGEEDLLGYNVKNTVTFVVPTAGKYLISFDTEVAIFDEYGDSKLCTKYAFETPTDNFTVTCEVWVEALANQEYATVGYTISALPVQNIAVGPNTIDVTAGYDNVLSFTAETAGEYKLVCDNADVSFGLDDGFGWINYFTDTYYENNVAKEAVIFTVEANTPFTVYVMAYADVADVEFTISALTAEEKYPTQVTVNDMDSAQAAIPANGSVDVVLDGAVEGTTYVFNWYSDYAVVKLGNVEFENGSVYFVYTEGMEISFVNKNADEDASVSDIQYSEGGQMSDTFDVYMNGNTMSSPMLTFNVSREYQGKTYQLTWDSDSYTVGSKLNNTTDGATGLTFENISYMNPIMTSVAPSDVEGKITFKAQEKVEPATELVVGSNTVSVNPANGTANVQLITATAGTYVISEVIDGDFLAPGMMGMMMPVQFPFVFETYDMGDGTFASAVYQVGTMESEVTFVIYEASELNAGDNAVDVPAGETVYGIYTCTVTQDINVVLANDETTATVQAWINYEWVDVDSSVAISPDNNMRFILKITSSATEADTADFTITPIVVEEE